MRRLLGRVSIVTLIATGASAALVGCYGDDESPASTPDHDAKREATGSVGLALDVGGGIIIDTATYAIAGPGGFTKTGPPRPQLGSDAVRHHRRPSRGNRLHGDHQRDRHRRLHDVHGLPRLRRDRPTRRPPSPSRLDCHETPKKGSVLLTGVTNVCPVADGISAMPAAVAVGGTIALEAEAHDSDNGPSALTYHWTASSGTLSSASVPSPTFTCTDAGTATLTLTVSDGDPTPSCADSVNVTVSCTMTEGGRRHQRRFHAGQRDRAEHVRRVLLGREGVRRLER